MRKSIKTKITQAKIRDDLDSPKAVRKIPKKSTASAKKSAVKVDSRKKTAKRIYINWDEVSRLAEIHCSYSEIAYALGVPYSKLVDHARFPEAFKSGWEKGCSNLRKAQFQSALEDRNPTMLIWLGKIVLGQRDSGEVQHQRPPAESIPDATADEKALDKLTVKEVEQLQRLIKKARPASDRIQ